MTMERVLVAAYLLMCVAIGVYASRTVLGSRDEYWVAGRRVSTGVNAMAIMAALASGGSIIGVMGLAYGRGIPFALSLFAGAVVGFPLASVLVARPLRNFGKYTITDFLVFRFPHPVVRWATPLLIVGSFTVYIVAQMKAAGITAEVLLGIPYNKAVAIATVVFILYVSIGGMVAVTWTDVAQGVLMLGVILGIAALIVAREGSPVTLLEAAAASDPKLGAVMDQPFSSYLGSFVIWAAAIPVVPHIVMRVFSARDAKGARASLNIAMVAFSLMVLAATLVIVPLGAVQFPGIKDADTVFLRVMEHEFSPLTRGLAVAAIIAAVMSTTDALLLACSSAIAHDLLGLKARRWVTITAPWVIGLTAMALAWSPPPLLTELYSAAIGLLSASLFIPTIAGLWWKKANRMGGAAAMGTGAVVYLALHFTSIVPPLSAILFALPISALAMWVTSRIGPPPGEDMIKQVAELHQP